MNTTTSEKYILSIDAGTTSARAIVFDQSGREVGKAQQEFKQIYPRPGWVEHDPTDIMGAVVGVMAEALVRANLTASQLTAIGVTNQRETTVVWDKNTGVPVHNAIVWQCRRTAERARTLKEQGLSQFIYARTGLVPDAYFSATKAEWILQNVAGARERAERGDLLFGTVDAYLLWRLSGGAIFATDYTNASRTMLFNIHTLEWDEELLKLFNIPRSMLPEVKPSAAYYGLTSKSVVGAEVPVCGVAGDQQSALFGQRCFNVGDAKCTYGTGCFLLMNTGDKAVQSTNGLVTTLGASHLKKPPYVLEGSVFVAGAVVQWLRDGLGVIATAGESEEWAKKVPDSGGVYLVPAFTGLGAPYWDSSARGVLCGVTRGTTRAHLIRAALESIAYQTADVISSMEKDAGVRVSALRVDGGASQNDFLMQFQADVSNASILRPSAAELTALGAAYLAGLGCGLYSSTDDICATADEFIFTPHMSEEEREAALSGWRLAVRKTLCT